MEPYVEKVKAHEKIIMICGEGDNSNYIYNHVSKEFEISKVFFVGKGSRKTFLKKGWICLKSPVKFYLSFIQGWF